jgi:hypothetical protein
MTASLATQVLRGQEVRRVSSQKVNSKKRDGYEYISKDWRTWDINKKS